MIFEYQDYRTFLKAAIQQRSEASSGYSRRAFADKVGVSNSFLSEVLSGKKALSMELGYKIAVNLDLIEAETHYFCLLVQIDNEKDPVFREQLLARSKEIVSRRSFHDLSADVFAVIADWYHFAILELTYLPSFQPDPHYIASRLDITPGAAEVALDRLLRLEMLVKDGNGRLRKSHDSILARSTVPSAAHRRFHRQYLEKALLSLESQAPDERVSQTDVLPMDSAALPEIARLADEFSAAVMRLSKNSKVRDGVYGLGVHLFRLTKKEGS